MQLVDSKLYSANITAFPSERQELALRRGSIRTERRNLVSWLKASSASERVLALVLAAFVLTASPALVATVRSTVSLSFQILAQAAHAGLIALQIFGR
jgi:hypothetical protein